MITLACDRCGSLVAYTIGERGVIPSSGGGFTVLNHNDQTSVSRLLCDNCFSELISHLQRNFEEEGTSSEEKLK